MFINLVFGIVALDDPHGFAEVVVEGYRFVLELADQEVLFAELVFEGAGLFEVGFGGGEIGFGGLCAGFEGGAF